MIKHTGIYHTCNNITIWPLDLTQLQMLQAAPEFLLQSLDLPPQKVYQPESLMELTENVIIPAVKNNPVSWFYHTKWLAIEADTQLLVGEFMLKKGIDRNGAVEIGYGIYPDYEGRGLMTEIIACFIDWARTASVLKGIKAETENGNDASVRVLEKNGFVQTAWPGDFTWWHLLLQQ